MKLHKIIFILFIGFILIGSEGCKKGPSSSHQKNKKKIKRGKPFRVQLRIAELKKIVIAVDGYSACGKSSTAKQVASLLGYHFIDSGAMYRAVTYFFVKNKVQLKSYRQVQDALNRGEVSFEGLSVLLNGENIDNEIRTVEINENVSIISAISEVRRKMVKQQQQLGKEKE